MKRSASPAGYEARPPLLGNTTMETFIQSTSSCIGCHAMARTTRRDRFVAADFTFTLNDARPLPAAPTPIRPARPGSVVHERARAIATRTYEMVPAPNVTARLHCQSCHLEAGTNPLSGLVGRILGALHAADEALPPHQPVLREQHERRTALRQ